MKTILNVIWLVLCGFWMALGYVAAGIICCILIITIPFGIASFRIAAYALWPFGRTVVRKPTAGVGSAIGNVIWLIFAGIWLAIGHIVTGIALCLTIIGIPLGIASFKMVPVSLLPLGAEIVDSDEVGVITAPPPRQRAY
ncbi:MULTISPECIES: YccF domain-containing protein [Actinomycetes]|uniref:YccF domain-containing protein n=1 Tax=Actinomycetes TaxID=1760 RepID=UPI0004BEEF80|nr:MULTISPECIES: YccF domain-containing protein [Actinomycetes]